MFEKINEIPNTELLQIELGKKIIEWCKKEQKTFLRHRMMIKVSNILIDCEKYKEGLDLISMTHYEVKKMEDMLLLVDIHLKETKAYINLENISKAKAALTAVKTSSTTVNISPARQTDIDMYSGILYSNDQDFVTAYSYFYEEYQGLHNLKSPKVETALVYMLLCKIMSHKNEEALSLVNSQIMANHQTSRIIMMKNIAKASQNKSITEFQKCLDFSKEEINRDLLIKTNISKLYSELLEDNLTKILEPYLRVEISFVAKLVGLSEKNILQK